MQAAIQRPAHQAHQIRRPRSPLEKFLEKCRELMAGVVDDSEGKAARYHPHKHKITDISGLLEVGWFHAGVTVVIALWEQSYDGFFAFCKSPARFGNFPSPHLRHMMAEQVAKDKIFYLKAAAEPVCRSSVCRIPSLG